MDHIKLWVLFVWGSWIWISIFIVCAFCDVRGLTLTMQYAAEVLSYNTAWHAYLFQLHKAVRCILLDSPGLSWDHSDRLGRCCQQDNGPRARGSQHYRSVNTEVIGRRQITHKLTSLSQIGSVLFFLKNMFLDTEKCILMVSCCAKKRNLVLGITADL